MASRETGVDAGTTPRRLTYCTNIHPGEAWSDVRANLEGHLLEVKQRFSPAASFPIGLRLSARAAEEVTPEEAQRFRGWCEETGTYVLTVNGFPYGRFHGTAVKHRVYQPDWRSDERVSYTKRIADLLVGWLEPGVPGSISTVPVAFREGFAPDDWAVVRRNVLDVLEHLDRLADAHGARVVLSFEPEPSCVIETTAQAIAFLDRLAPPATLARHVGICFDCCHQAVEFEEPRDSLRLLRGAGVTIGKVQVSSALRATREEMAMLEPFAEPIYLHQVVARGEDETLHRYDDLPRFLAERVPHGEPGPTIEECRVHFHVPIFADHLGPCGTTRFFLEAILPELDTETPLEVETYTWDVLPRELRTTSVAESIVRELRWVEQSI